MTTNGSCLCGTVKFEVADNGFAAAFNCYCTNCRKASGAQMGTFFQVRSKAFRWTAGADLIGSYESSPGNPRAFCKNCGARVPWQGKLPTMIVPGGALDGDPGMRPYAVFYERSKAEWCSTENDAQVFSELPPQTFWGDFMMRILGR